MKIINEDWTTMDNNSSLTSSHLTIAEEDQQRSLKIDVLNEGTINEPVWGTL